MARPTLPRWARGPAVAALAALSAAAALWAAVRADDCPVALLDPERMGPLVLVDARGEVLRAVAAPDGRRTPWVRLAEVPLAAREVVLAGEDARFFAHPGVDAWSIARAAWLDLRAGRAAFGASTLSMQLVRLVLHPNAPRTWPNKLREAVLALRLERALTKHQILEQYLNRAYFGRGAVGISAAALRYFGKPIQQLTDAEATVLAVVSRRPVGYALDRQFARATARRDHVAALLVERGKWPASLAAALTAAPIRATLSPWPFAAPHFCDQVIQGLPSDVAARGGTVHTTLDLHLQRRIEAGLRRHVSESGVLGIAQAGVVVLTAGSAQVRAQVGSADYAEAALDITTWRRHPGSALKPFVYGVALESGANPGTTALDIHDVPSDYRVKRLTQPERGPVSLRAALAGSLNLAAVHVLENVGLDAVLDKLAAAGIGPLTGGAAVYGLRLALGAPRVRLIDVVASYRFLVREGRVRTPQAVVAVVSPNGEAWRPRQASERSVFAAETAWQLMDMLADGDARSAVFGPDLPLDLPFRVAAKTGTSRGFSDTVAIGATGQWLAGAWAGNFDGRGSFGAMAMVTAAPLLRMALLAASDGRAQTLPARPPGLRQVEVCALSGGVATANCPHTRLLAATAAQTPRTACDWHRRDGQGRQMVAWPAEARAWAAAHRDWTLPAASEAVP